MGKTYNYNGERDFESWYKNNYGTAYDGSSFVRPEGMSDTVWNSISPLYSHYNSAKKYAQDTIETNDYYDGQKTDLLSRYSKAFAALDEEKNIAQQNASISNAKLMKYLPMQLRAQGLEGLGVSETALIDANNKYINTMGDISSDYSKNKLALEEEQTTNLNELEKYRRGELSSISDKNDESAKQAADSALEKYNQGIEKEQTAAYDAALMEIETWDIKDADKMAKKITETYGGKVSDSDLQKLLAYGSTEVQGDTESEWAKNYEFAIESIKNSSISDEAAMNQYILTNFNGKVSPEDWSLLVSLGKNVVTANQQAKWEKNYNSAVDDINSWEITDIYEMRKKIDEEYGSGPYSVGEENLEKLYKEGEKRIEELKAESKAAKASTISGMIQAYLGNGEYQNAAKLMKENKEILDPNEYTLWETTISDEEKRINNEVTTTIKNINALHGTAKLGAIYEALELLEEYDLSDDVRDEYEKQIKGDITSKRVGTRWDDGNNIDIKVGGKWFDLKQSGKLSSEEQYRLNELTTGDRDKRPANGTVTFIGSSAFVSHDNNWYLLKNDRDTVYSMINHEPNKLQAIGALTDDFLYYTANNAPEMANETWNELNNYLKNRK